MEAARTEEIVSKAEALMSDNVKSFFKLNDEVFKASVPKIVLAHGEENAHNVLAALVVCHYLDPA